MNFDAKINLINGWGHPSIIIADTVIIARSNRNIVDSYTKSSLINHHLSRRHTFGL